MSDCKIPVGVSAKIIDQESCVIESDDKRYIQLSRSDSISLVNTIETRPDDKGGTEEVIIIKEREVIVDIYKGDVNGDKVLDKVIVSTTRATNAIETKVYFGHDGDDEDKKPDQYLNFTGVFKNLDQGRTQNLKYTTWRNESSYLRYNSTYPIEEDKSILWLSVP